MESALTTFLICLSAASLWAQGQVNQEQINAVLAGKTNIAKASWWGFDPQDSTQALQAAINSGADKVIVEAMEGPWIVEPISLASNQEVVFEEGAVVEAKRGSFKGKTECLFTARMVENVTLVGYGATLRMRKADYQGAEYEKAEWRHVLSLRGARNIKVIGLTLAESGGDGIYVGVGEGGVPCENIVIRDVICERNHRQGISVISVRNLLIENTIMRETSGTPPMAGIDFEPNGPTEELVNCVMRNCVSENNVGDGYDFYIPTLNATSASVSIRLENCKSVGNSRAINFTTGNGEAEAVGGEASFVNCVFEGSRGPAIIIRDKPAVELPLSFVNCSIVNCGVDQPAPIVFVAGANASRPIGGVNFANCKLVEPVDRKPMAMQDFSGGTPAIAITGELAVEREGKSSQITLTDALLDEWMPTRRLKAIPAYDMSDIQLTPLLTEWHPGELAGAMRVRGSVKLAMYARDGDSVSFTVRYAQVGQYSGEGMLVKVTSPSGAEVLAKPAAFKQDTSFEFVAPEAGIYHVSWDSRSNAAQVVQTTHPICLVTEGEPMHFIGTTGDVFFYVPAAVTEFGVKVFGEGSGEGVRAALYDPDDRLVADKDDITEPHQFVVTREPTDQGQIWRLHLAKPSRLFLEDFYLQLQGVPSVLAPTRSSLLAPAPR